MNFHLSRRTLLGAALAVPLAGMIAAPAASASMNSTGGFGKLLGKSIPKAGYENIEHSALFYERGITVSRQGFSMSRKSEYALSKHWLNSTGFPTGHMYIDSRGYSMQEFGTSFLIWQPKAKKVGRVSGLGLVDYGNSPFKDVATSHDHYSSIFRAAQWGIAQGWPDGTFKPNAPVLRDAFAAFCYRMAGSPAYVPPAKSPFKDVTRRTLFYKEICWLHSKGISEGWPDGTYRPLSRIKRDAIAAMLYRMAPKGRFSFKPMATSAFADVSASDIFAKEIAWLGASGISRGWVQDENMDFADWTYEFRPLADATRADAAAFLVRWNALFGPFRPE